MGRGEPDVFSETRGVSGYHFGAMEVQESPFLHAGMGSPQERDCSVKSTQGVSATDSKVVSTSPELRAARQQPLFPADTELRQRKLGELCRVTTFWRPDVCARHARIASGGNPFQGSDVFRMNVLATTVKVWQ